MAVRGLYMADGQEHRSEDRSLAEAQDVFTRYGDIPVAYAVFRVKLNDDATEVIDTEYVYANSLYREWLGYEDVELVGHSFLESVDDASKTWFPYCYRAAVLHERVHDTIYSPEINSWLSFNVEPSTIEGCCVFAFTRVDEEHREQELIEAERDTSDVIIGITDSLNNGMADYESSMNSLLESMSRVIHPERLYIFERWESTSDNTFEWCAPGVEPQIGMLQNLDNSEFKTWDRMLATDSVVVIPDVSAYKGVDDRLYELLTMQGIDRLLAVPFYDRGELIGYLGADNYALDERLDTRRLLETVASFVSARMANRRLMDKLEQVSTHDSLTGILNRRGIDATVEKHIAHHVGEPFLIALADVDDFKSINDLYGHAVGDEALRMLARKLLQVMPDDALIGRNGGDEALVMLYRETADDVDALFDELVNGDLSFEHDGKRYEVTISVGYSWCDGSAEDLPAAYSRADAALYAVKYNGKSGYCKFEPGQEARYRLQLGFSSRKVAENLPEAAVVLEPGTAKILFANDAMVNLLGCEGVQDLMAFSRGSLVDLIHPDDRKGSDKAFRAPVGQKTRFPLRLIDKQGSEKNVIFSGWHVDLGNGKESVNAVFFEVE